MSLKTTALCLLLILAVLSNESHALTTNANITVRNPLGVILVNNQPMTCVYQGNSLGGAFDSPTVCGSYTSSPGSISRSNVSCTYPFNKNYTVEGAWTANVTFYHYGVENSGVPIDTTQNPPYDTNATPPTGQRIGDCTGTANCYSDPQCNYTINESALITIFTVNWDNNDTDCTNQSASNVWFPTVSGGSNGKCCGDDGVNDNFYYSNETVCMGCDKGVVKTNTTARKCPLATCSPSGNWNQTYCANLSIYAEPPSTPQGVCFGTNVRFVCNYTDGYGNPIPQLPPPYHTTSQVNITIDTQHYASGYENPDNPEVKYNETLGVYYYENNTLEQGLHPWNCSAYKENYTPLQVSGEYRISEPNSSTISINVTPPQPAPYGTPVNFTASYRDASNGAALSQGTCTLYINAIPYNTSFNSTLNLYQLITDEVYPGPNSYEFVCIQPCFAIARASDIYYVSFSSEFRYPILTVEDPTYSLNSSAAYHKIIKKSPDAPETLVRKIGSGYNASGWVYEMVVKPAAETPTCADIQAPDRSKILLVKNSSLIANTTACPQVNEFAGVIFEDDACGFSYSGCTLTVPYVYHFTSHIYSNIPNSTYVLLNGENNNTGRVYDISKLREFYFNGYYIEANLAPNFLMRLAGRLTPSPYGFESFVKVEAFPEDKSSVDYIYFNRTFNPPHYKIKGMPNCENETACNDPSLPHFQLDNETALVNSTAPYTHLCLYGVERFATGHDYMTSSCIGECRFDSDCRNSPYGDLCCGGVCKCSAGESCCAGSCCVISECPNGVCEPGETYVTCPQDCCEADCTAKYDNTCHGECNGYSGCSNFVAACNNQPVGVTVCADGYTAGSCCKGPTYSCGANSTGSCPPDYCQGGSSLCEYYPGSCSIPCAGGACTSCSAPSCSVSCHTCYGPVTYGDCCPADHCQGSSFFVYYVHSYCFTICGCSGGHCTASCSPWCPEFSQNCAYYGQVCTICGCVPPEYIHKPGYGCI